MASSTVDPRRWIWQRSPLLGRLLGGCIGLLVPCALGYGLGYVIGTWAVLPCIFLNVFVVYAAFEVGGLFAALAALLGFVPMIGGTFEAPNLRALAREPQALASLDEIDEVGGDLFVFPAVVPDSQRFGVHSTTRPGRRGPVTSTTIVSPLVGADGRVHAWSCGSSLGEWPGGVTAGWRMKEGWSCAAAAERAVKQHKLTVVPDAPLLEVATDLEALRAEHRMFWTASTWMLAGYAVMVLVGSAWVGLRGRGASTREGAGGS